MLMMAEAHDHVISICFLKSPIGVSTVADSVPTPDNLKVLSHRFRVISATVSLHEVSSIFPRPPRSCPPLVARLSASSAHSKGNTKCITFCIHLDKCNPLMCNFVQSVDLQIKSGICKASVRAHRSTSATRQQHLSQFSACALGLPRVCKCGVAGATKI